MTLLFTPPVTPPLDGSHVPAVPATPAVPEQLPAALPVRTAVSRRSGPAGRALLGAVLAVVAGLAGAVIVLMPHATAPAEPPVPAPPIPGPAFPGTDRPLEPGQPAEVAPPARQ